MVRLIRVPSSLDQFFRPLRGPFHWDHVTDFRLLGLAMAARWGRRTVAHVSRDLDAEPHRTRFNTCFLVARWDPEAALRQQAPVLGRGLHPGKGDILSRLLADSKQAKRGTCLAAVATRKDSVTEASSRGLQDVGALVVCRTPVMPWEIRLSVKPALDHRAVGERPEAAVGARPLPASPLSGGRDTPASGLLRLCPPDPPAPCASRCTRPPDT
jgi:hypothetical protein